MNCKWKYLFLEFYVRKCARLFHTCILFTEGEEVTLEIQVSGDPLPEATWYKNGKKIKDNAKTKVQVDGDICRLIIPKAAADMTGKYSVKIKNKHGSEECAAQLTVSLKG